jgi:hypothetical protein
MQRNVLLAAFLAAALALLLASPKKAAGGGVIVITPAETTLESCPRGSPARWRGGNDPRAIVTDCLDQPSGATVQVSTSFRDGRTYSTLPGIDRRALPICFYVAPAGSGDIDGECRQPISRVGRYLPGVRSFTLARYRRQGPRYLYGIASRDVERITVRAPAADWSQRARFASLTPPGVAARGMRADATLFVAEIPAGIGICGGLEVMGEDRFGSLGSYPLRPRSAWLRGPVELPGSRACRAARRAESRPHRGDLGGPLGQAIAAAVRVISAVLSRIFSEDPPAATASGPAVGPPTPDYHRPIPGYQTVLVVRPGSHYSPKLTLSTGGLADGLREGWVREGIAARVGRPGPGATLIAITDPERGRRELRFDELIWVAGNLWRSGTSGEARLNRADYRLLRFGYRGR